jgi:hypothetical protein
VTELDSRVGALEAWRESHSSVLVRIESKVDSLLDRDAQRRGRLELLRGLSAAVWLTIATGIAGAVAVVLHIGR